MPPCPLSVIVFLPSTRSLASSAAADCAVVTCQRKKKGGCGLLDTLSHSFTTHTRPRLLLRPQPPPSAPTFPPSSLRSSFYIIMCCAFLFSFFFGVCLRVSSCYVLLPVDSPAPVSFPLHLCLFLFCLAGPDGVEPARPRRVSFRTGRHSLSCFFLSFFGFFVGLNAVLCDTPTHPPTPSSALGALTVVCDARTSQHHHRVCVSLCASMCVDVCVGVLVVVSACVCVSFALCVDLCACLCCSAGSRLFLRVSDPRRVLGHVVLACFLAFFPPPSSSRLCPTDIMDKTSQQSQHETQDKRKGESGTCRP